MRKRDTQTSTNARKGIEVLIPILTDLDLQKVRNLVEDEFEERREVARTSGGFHG